LNKKTINQPTKDPAVVINMKNTKMNENVAGKKYELQIDRIVVEKVD
jgi:hypothetical protein